MLQYRNMQKEIEATFLSINKELIREKLENNGFKLKYPEYLMRRKTFDFPNKTPGINKWGRVRQEFNKVTMTIKEIRGTGINDVFESEIIVNDFDKATEFFEVCGVFVKAFQENMREVWTNSTVEVTIDTWPGLKPFIEIEGQTEEIVRNISEKLNFDFKEAVFGSIDLVYEKELGISAKEIISLPEITFKNPPKSK